MHREHPAAAALAALALAFVALAAGPLAAQAKVPTTAEEAPRIEGPELKRLLEKGEAVLVDVRGRDAWTNGHAEGAIHIPLDELGARLKELPKNKLIAAYCTWTAEGTSARAALQLLQNGYPRAAALKGGLGAWEKAGGKVVKP